MRRNGSPHDRLQRHDSCFPCDAAGRAVAGDDAYRKAVSLRPQRSPKVWIWSPGMKAGAFYAMNPKADAYHWTELQYTSEERLNRKLKYESLVRQYSILEKKPGGHLQEKLEAAEEIEAFTKYRTGADTGKYETKQYLDAYVQYLEQATW